METERGAELPRQKEVAKGTGWREARFQTILRQAWGFGLVYKGKQSFYHFRMRREADWPLVCLLFSFPFH